MDSCTRGQHVTRMRIHNGGSVTVTRVELSIGSLDLFRFDALDHAFPRHSHDRFTLGVLGEGNGTIRMNGSSWRADDGAILAIPPDAAHSADPIRNRGWTYRSLYPSQALMNAALDSRDAEIVFESPIVHDAEYATRIDILHRQLESGTISLCVEENLLERLGNIATTHGRVAPRTVKPDAKSAGRARLYLDENYSRAVKLSELSSLCELSPFQLIRSFRRFAGMTPHAYLMQVRANRARDMLVGREGISSVAYRCGFSDQSHLTRIFKRIFGVTPGAYVEAGGVS